MVKKLVKVLALTLVAVLAASTFLTGCKNKDNKYLPPVPEITLSSQGGELEQYDYVRVESSVQNFSGVLTWASSNPQVIDVVKAQDANSAEIRAVGVGSADITVTAGETQKKISFTVKSGNFEPAMTLEREEMALMINAKLSVSPELSYRTKKLSGSFTYESENPSVAGVDGNGIVTAMAEGSTIITVNGSYYGFSDTASVAVTVSKIAVNYVDTFTLYTDSDKVFDEFPSSKAKEEILLEITDHNGDLIDVDCMWVSGDTDLLEIAGGNVIAKQIDQATSVEIDISFIYEGKTHNIIVTVQLLPFPEVVIEENITDIRLYKTGYDGYVSQKELVFGTDYSVSFNGKPIPVSEIDFDIANSGIATVNQEKSLVSYAGHGETTLTISYEYEGIKGEKSIPIQCIDPVKYGSAGTGNSTIDTLEGLKVILQKDSVFSYGEAISLKGNTSDDYFIRLHILPERASKALNPASGWASKVSYEARYLYIKLTDKYDSGNYIVLAASAGWSVNEGQVFLSAGTGKWLELDHNKALPQTRGRQDGTVSGALNNNFYGTHIKSSFGGYWLMTKGYIAPTGSNLTYDINFSMENKVIYSYGAIGISNTNNDHKKHHIVDLGNGANFELNATQYAWAGWSAANTNEEVYVSIWADEYRPVANGGNNMFTFVIDSLNDKDVDATKSNIIKK